MLGITGTKWRRNKPSPRKSRRSKRHTKLPVGVGFGIRTPEQAAAVARHGGAPVVPVPPSSTRVKARSSISNGKPTPEPAAGVFADVKALPGGVRTSASRNFSRCDHSWNGPDRSL